MKYPQLVSVRAVNAISDWLVSRLEKLGVDAPLVYSRLLLSLLHTPLQVNALDLAETPQLKGFIGRKGGRYLTPSDAETLKRFAAVESLMDAASDQQKTEVEDLVDELCEKLREIEKQNNLESDINIIKVTSSDIEKTKKSSMQSGSPSTEDPTRKYYRAFPPLSGELFDNTKFFSKQMPLSWPCGGGGTTNKSSSISNTNVVSNTAGVKKKVKRRRSQGLVKGKQAFVKKSSMLNNNNNTNNNNNNNNNDNDSSSLWDTNFEGSWEMGHDLIREFIIKQNNKRNRSISESDASKFIELNNNIKTTTDQLRRFGDCDVDGGIIRNNNYNYDGSNLIRNMVQATYAAKEQHFIDYDSLENDENTELFSPTTSSTTNDTTTTSSLLLFGYNNAIRDEGYATPDTLTSFGELGDVAASNEPPRRLYEREEILNETIDIIHNHHNAVEKDNNLALFEAKFNSSVEALWGDDGGKDDDGGGEHENNVNQNELNIFWSNYYKHQYKPESDIHLNPIFKQQPQLNDNDYLVEQCIKSDMIPVDISGLLESPHQTNNNSNSKQDLLLNINKKHEFIQAGTNLQNSIWSDNPNTDCENNEENEGTNNNNGYSRELWEKDEIKNKIENNSTFQPMATASEYSIENFVNFSKWSDCSYEAPFVPQKTTQSKLNSTDYGTSTSSFGFKSLPILYNNKKNFDNNSGYYKQEMNLMQNHQLIMNNKSNNSLDNRRNGTSSKITLANHSETSGFTEVSPSSSGLSSIGYLTYDKQERSYKNDLNFLNSKKCLTQQNPTNTNPTTNEDENLLISERTHFRPIKQTYVDGYTFDIRSNIDVIKYERSETGSMYLDLEKYAIYNMLNTTSNDDQDDDDCDDDDETNNFVLKFCVKQIEKCCQTDDDNENLLLNPDSLIIDFDEFKDDITTYRCDDHPLADDIEMECEIHDQWSSSMTKYKTTKCLNNNIQHHSQQHTLWGHCSSCNNNNNNHPHIKSFPANRLMKDELCADGDEIMSDLKYMQNLFIGTTDWDDDDGDGNDNGDGERINNNIIVNDNINDGSLMEINKQIIRNSNDEREEQQKIYCNVNKLISDLLKPETAKSLAQVLGCHQGQTLLQEIALNEQQKKTQPNNEPDKQKQEHQEQQDDAIRRNIFHFTNIPGDEKNNNNLIKETNIINNNNNYMMSSSSVDDVFGLWSYNIDNAWENCCNLKIKTDFELLFEKDKGKHDIDIITLLNNHNNIGDNNYEPSIAIKDEDNIYVPICLDLLQDNDDVDDGIIIKENHNNIHHQLNVINPKKIVINKLARFDRKRRHSAASQNLNDDINMAIESGHYGNKLILEDGGTKDNKYDLTTVITCKYWTKDSLYEMGQIEMNPSSILKHVQMVSRPLTR